MDRSHDAGRIEGSGRHRLGTAVALGLGTLATWRVSRLIVAEDGPGDALVTLRRSVDGTPLAGLMDCFACTSVWVGAGVAVALFGRRLQMPDLAVAALALSGAAMLVERVVAEPELVAEFPPEPGFLPEPDEDSPLVTVVGT